MVNVSYKRWTQKEEDFLEINSGLLTTEEIAKKLNRTIYSVLTHKTRLKIGKFDNFYTFNSLEYDLGISRETIRRYSIMGLINHRRTTWTNGIRRPAIIFEKDVIDFIKSYWYKLKENLITNPIFLKVYKLVKDDSKLKTKFYCSFCKYHHYSNSRRFRWHLRYKKELMYVS